MNAKKPDNWREVNAKYFENAFSMCKRYMWQNKGHVYTENSNGVMTASNMQAWEDIKDITPKGWAKKNVKLVKPS